MQNYKILISDRVYSDWSLVDNVTLETVEKIDINPEKEKLFSSDVFEYENNKTKILHSSVRSMPYIPGIIVLKGDKRYGKYKEKYLYKCIPDDKRFPEFLLPYKLTMGFGKNIDNKYIVFKFDNWNSKHPQGTVVSVLGDVSELEHFYEYQLYCKSLYASIQQFNKATTASLKKQTENEIIENIINKKKLIDKTNEYVFSIDSNDTTDYDDAFSIKKISDNSYNLTIYISNVPLWMEELGLWKSFSDRISTIYLPDRKRPMLPTILSECLCSLCENNVRLAFALEIIIMDGEIIGYSFNNVYVNLKKNHVYDSNELIKDEHYKMLFNVTEKLSTKYRYTSKVKGSYDLVAYLMILMNYYSANEMIKYNNGIYRSVIPLNNNNKQFKDKNLPENVLGFLSYWNSYCGQYDLYDKKRCHDMLNLESYIHCTSPIRRLVDLLNMAKLQENLNMVNFGDSYKDFNTYWVSKIDYINTTMRSIRKIQSDCNLLKMCTDDISLQDRELDGYIFDKIIRNDGLYQYVVYLEHLKNVSRITLRHDISDYSKQKFKLYIFHDEATLKKKLRLHIII